jgi:hypothetical protein
VGLALVWLKLAGQGMQWEAGTMHPPVVAPTHSRLFLAKMPAVILLPLPGSIHPYALPGSTTHPLTHLQLFLAKMPAYCLASAFLGWHNTCASSSSLRACGKAPGGRQVRQRFR